MKNIYLFILSFAFITSANSQVIRYTLMDVDSKDREKFETAGAGSQDALPGAAGALAAGEGRVAGCP